MSVTCRLLSGLFLSLLFIAAPVPCQIPAKFTNLEVLPKDISSADLVATMRGMAGALGVRCTHCHVGPEDLQGMDFAADEKQTKRIARTMLRMVHEMNAQFVRGLPPREGPRQEVTCVMCHRRAGMPPRPLYEILFSTASAAGPDAAIAEYRALRKDFFGSGLYDFREPTLNIVATRLRENKRPDLAIAILKVNAEFFPQSANVQSALGDASFENGDLTDAEAYYQRALALQPSHTWAASRLKEVRSKRAPQ